MKKLLTTILLTISVSAFAAVEPNEQQYVNAICAFDDNIATAQSLEDFTEFASLDLADYIRVQFQAFGDAIRYRPDDIAPTAAVGFKRVEDQPEFFWSGQLQKIQFIEVSTDSEIFVCLWRDPLKGKP